MVYRAHVTDSELAPLVYPESPSGFHGVYSRAGRPVGWWTAKGFRKRYLGCRATPIEAAQLVAAHWRSLYGDDWPRLFALRLANPWAVHRVRVESTARVWFRGDEGRWGWQPPPDDFRFGWPCGYRLTVWILGQKQFLAPPRAGATYFASKAQARDYYLDWSRREFGLFAPLMLRRGSSGTRSAVSHRPSGGFPHPTRE